MLVLVHRVSALRVLNPIQLQLEMDSAKAFEYLLRIPNTPVTGAHVLWRDRGNLEEIVGRGSTTYDNNSALVKEWAKCYYLHLGLMQATHRRWRKPMVLRTCN